MALYGKSRRCIENIFREGMMTATSVVVAVLCALLITSFMALILLCVAMFMIASTMDKESWRNNDKGKGYSEDD